MKYFFDNCISPRFPAMLNALGMEAVALREIFPADLDDVALFGKLRGSGMVFITADDRQKTRRHEARALKEAGLMALWFGRSWTRKKFWDQAVWIIRRWPMIDAFARSVVTGTCAEIKENGRAMAFVLE